MKKLLSLFLTASLLAACGGYKAPEEETNSEEPQTETEPEATAEAESETQEEDNTAVTASSEYDSVGEFPASGFTVVLPGDFVLNMSGELSELKDGGELEYGMGIITANWDYLLRSEEERNGFYEWLQENYDNDFSEEDNQKVEDFYAPIMPFIQIIAINRGRGMDEIMKQLFSGREDIVEEAVEIGQNDGYTYYFIKYNLEHPVLAEKIEGLSSEVIDGFKEARDTAAAHPEWYTFSKVVPTFVPPEIGTEVNFTTTTLEGSEVRSQDIFDANEITVVNVWRTWCGVCIDEFPEFAQIAQDFRNQDVGVVTYCADAKDSEKIAEAKAIVEDYGFDLNLADSEEISRTFTFMGTPYTYFVGRDGKILTYPIAGSDTARVREYVEKLLRGETVNEPAEVKKPDGNRSYVVQVKDQNGDPVKGAMVSFCSDVSCDVAETDQNGVAVFTGPAYAYGIHFVQLPGGYAKAEGNENAVMDADGGSMTLDVVKE